MNKILITLKKELRSIIRDRKTLIRILLFPLIIPAIIILYGEMFENLDNEVTTYDIGINYQLSEEEKIILEENNLNATYNTTEEIENMYKEKEIDGYILYNKDTNTYHIYVDQSTNSGMVVSEYSTNYLNTYSLLLTNTYLVGEGIDLEEAYNNFNIEYEELSSSNYILTLIISVCVTYIIMSIVISTGNMATGTTATERENGTLETILTFPISNTELIIGKYLSSVVLGFISSLIAFILMILSINIAKLHYTMFENTIFIINFKTISLCIALILLASLFIAGIALALCGMSKSYKEAQSSVSFLNIITIIPMFLSMSEINIKTIYYLVPIFNHEQVILDIFNNNISLNNILITIISTIIYIIIVIYLVIKAYNSEKVLFTK